MTWELMKRTLRNPALWIFAAMSSVGAVFEPLFMGVMGSFILASLVPIAVPPSASMFEAALPIPGLAIMRARLFCALTLAIPLVLTLLIATPLRLRAPLDPQVVLALAAVVIVAAMMLYLVPARVGPIPRNDQLRVAAVVVTGATLVYFTPAVWALGAMAVSALVLYNVRVARIPDVIVNQTSRSDTKLSRSEKSQRDVRGSWPWNAVRRTIFPTTVALSPLIGVSAGIGSGGIGILYFIGLLIWMPIFVRPRVAWMAPLPISPRTRLLLMLSPTFVLSFSSAAIFANIPGARSGSLTTDAPGQYEDDINVTRVAINHWHRYELGNTPNISAPWGESVLADTLSVYGVRIYNPFTISDGNSERFRDWQFARATTAVFGYPIAREEYRRLSAEDALPPTAARQLRLIYARLAFIAAFALAVLYLSELSRWHRLRRGYSSLVVACGPVPFLLFVPLVGAALVFQVRTDGDLIAPLIDAGMLRIAPWLPSSTFLTVLVCVVPVVVLYFLLEWQFERSERSTADSFSAATTS